MSVCQMPVCKHKRPIKMGCSECYFEGLNDNAEIQESFVKESFDTRLDIIFKTLARIDVDVTKISFDHDKSKSAIDNLWEDHARKINDIENLCAAIEKIQDGNDKTSSFIEDLKTEWRKGVDEYNGWWKEVEARISKIENDLNSMDGLKEIWLAINELRVHKPKPFGSKPHKCPVCHGSGRCLIHPDFEATSDPNVSPRKHITAQWIDCNACDRKGILWG